MENISFDLNSFINTHPAMFAFIIIVFVSGCFSIGFLPLLTGVFFFISLEALAPELLLIVFSSIFIFFPSTNKLS